MSIYVELTEAFNAGKPRAVLSSGQAVVMHRLAVMSKDGDWILHANEDRLKVYLDAADAWRNAWPAVEAEVEGLSLEEAHRHIVLRADELLPCLPMGEIGT